MISVEETGFREKVCICILSKSSVINKGTGAGAQRLIIGGDITKTFFI